ncbi:response regulator [Archangium violaceum]|uniref:response regulator n=1 Tax=Archangium violaceum TaxID=83451 RepID=UPI00193B0CE8|nr:response regulator [Archangium violaceum]QRK07697.1 response regulator [Archangium violaceum]
MSNCPSKKRILVIDDSEAIHTDFKRILNPEQRRSRGDIDMLEEALFGPTQTRGNASAEPDFEVDSAFQGQEGVAKIRASMQNNQPYALVFLDYRMPPGWNGAETLRRLREVAPSLRVVLCSAYSDYSWAELVREFSDLQLLKELRKPFNGQEVRQLAIKLTGEDDDPSHAPT